MSSGLSLANKCQLIFGSAVLLILAGALSVPWFHTAEVVKSNQLEVSRQLADTWMENGFMLGRSEGIPIPMRVVMIDEIMPESEPDLFLVQSIERFQEDPDQVELFDQASLDGEILYRYARAIRESQWRLLEDPRFISFVPNVIDTSISDPLRAVLVIDRTSQFAAGQILRSRMYILATGIFAGLLAILLFNFILTKLILSPVRRLRETTELVQKGNLDIRSMIRTGDDFEQLSRAFDEMLDELTNSQQRLTAVNEALDLKVMELSEANIGLFESNRLKSEFLANVSHELKTPLNSIIGFAELLSETAQSDKNADPKRLRYLENIIKSGRALLDMINELLEMAKIEAGRVEVTIEPTSMADLVDGLIAVMRPLSLARRIEIVDRVPGGLPMIDTDPGKLQQILYNFLSNAIKFSPEEGRVVISVERVTRQDHEQGIRIGVTDKGPGIPYDMQDSIFEKFRQVDSSHTREHSGTGLGLAICRELAELIGAHVSLVSEPSRGATFYVELPMKYHTENLRPLMDTA
ncbi:MAG: hypothetical protein CMJ32_11495 [Phycisphaerae bacterium]|nr:hypothetical protein [Phycisphaerae bacterium]